MECSIGQAMGKVLREGPCPLPWLCAHVMLRAMKVLSKSALVAAGISAALLLGCQRETTSKLQPPGGKQAPGAAITAKPAQPAKPVVPITAPEISPPSLGGEGKRVVHLIYSSNVDGEVEPCG